MSDYADKVAAQIVHPSPPLVPIQQVLQLVAAGVRAGYGYGHGVRASEDSK